MRSFSDSISFGAAASRTSRNSAFNPAPSSRSPAACHLGQPLAIRLHQPACCVHQGRSSTHQFARARSPSDGFRLRTAMRTGPIARIDARQPCQCRASCRSSFRLLLVINRTFCACATITLYQPVNSRLNPRGMWSQSSRAMRLCVSLQYSVSSLPVSSPLSVPE